MIKPVDRFARHEFDGFKSAPRPWLSDQLGLVEADNRLGQRGGSEQRSIMITANQPFGEWGKILPDPAMALAAVDRLVHHATIVELNGDSYRRRTAIQKKRKDRGGSTFLCSRSVRHCRRQSEDGVHNAIEKHYPRC